MTKSAEVLCLVWLILAVVAIATHVDPAFTMGCIIMIGIERIAGRTP